MKKWIRLLQVLITLIVLKSSLNLLPKSNEIDCGQGRFLDSENKCAFCSNGCTKCSDENTILQNKECKYCS